MTDVTHVLAALERGDPTAADQLLPLVDAELRRLAVNRLAQELGSHTVQATTLVHEALVRLAGSDHQECDWRVRAQFYAAAAEAMRRMLVENARRKRRLKPILAYPQDDTETVAVVMTDVREDVVALDDALTKLTAVDKQATDVVQLRYFAGLSFPEVAAALGLSARTAEQKWEYARAWLHCEIHESDGELSMK